MLAIFGDILVINCLGSYRHFQREQTDALAVCVGSAELNVGVLRLWYHKVSFAGSLSSEMLTAGLSVERTERGRKDKQAQMKPTTISATLSGFKFITCTSACACRLTPLWVCTHWRSIKCTFNQEGSLWERQRTVSTIKKNLFWE